MTTLLQDARYGLRMLAKNPGFTAIVVATLGLGIAVNTTIFSAVSAILLRKPPVHDPGHLLTVSSKNLAGGDDLQPVSIPDFESWRDENHVFQEMAAAETGRSFTLTGKQEPESVNGDMVTPNYFKVTGLAPMLGRVFLPGEAQSGNDHVVILSNSLWRERYNADPNVIGTGTEIDHQPYTIIGVMPVGADVPMPWQPPRIWTPLVFSQQALTPSARGERNIDMVLARLKPGVTIQRAQAEMDGINRLLVQAYPKTNKDWGVTVLTLQEFIIEKPHVRAAMMVLMTMVGFVLLIACANIAGLLLARGSARAHEMAVRSAVGASRVRLIRQMLVESLLLGLAGGAAGLLLSLWGITLLRAGFSFNFYGAQQAQLFHMDVPTLLFTAAISFFTAILFGVAPAFRASKVSPGDALNESSRTSSGGFARSRLRSGLVACEIALSVALLAGAGIMAQFVLAELRVELGFNPNHVLLAGVSLKSPQNKTPDSQIAFFREAVQKLRAIPGVQSAEAASDTPLDGYWTTTFSIVGQPPLPKSKRPTVQDFVVGPDYFHTYEIALLKGREFSESDNTHSPIVAVVSQDFARLYFPKGDAIGQEVEVDNKRPQPAQIVGIVSSVLPFYGHFGPSPQIYESYLQIPQSDMSLVVRSAMPAAALAPMLNRAVWSVDKDQPLGAIKTMKEVAADSEGGDKLMVALMGIFAGLSLVMAAVGIYGVIAWSVSQRTREIGIRIAMGAHRKDVLRLVMRQGGLLTAIGGALGLAMALPLPRVFGAIFEGYMHAQGPLVAFVVTATVALVSLLATYIPARRAMKVDPMVALRYE